MDGFCPHQRSGPLFVISGRLFALGFFPEASDAFIVMAGSLSSHIPRESGSLSPQIPGLLGYTYSSVTMLCPPAGGGGGTTV